MFTPAPSPPYIHAQLVIDDAPLNLTVASLQVYGNLSLGSPTCRLSSAISITFVPATGVATGQMALRVGPRISSRRALYLLTDTEIPACC